MIIGNFFKGFFAKYSRHLGFKRFGEKAVDIVITIVHKNKTAVVDILFEIVPFGFIELHQLMSGQIAEGTVENFIACQENNVFASINFNCCVLNERIKQIRIEKSEEEPGWFQSSPMNQLA